MRIAITDVTCFAGDAIRRRVQEDASRELLVVEDVQLLEDPERFLQTIRGFDAVIHTYHCSDPTVSDDTLLHHNVSITENVLEAAKRAGVNKFILVSSADASLADCDRVFWNEKKNLPAPPLSTYVQSRLLAEELVLGAGSKEAHNIVLRPARLWGPGDTEWLPEVLCHALGGRVHLPGGGKSMAGLTYIEHLVQAVEASLSEQAPRWGTYYLGDAEVLSWKEWFTMLLVPLGLKPPRRGLPRVLATSIAKKGWSQSPFASSWERSVEFSYSAHFDCGKATHDLNFEASVPTETGIQQTLAWIDSLGGLSALCQTAPKTKSLGGSSPAKSVRAPHSG